MSEIVLKIKKYIDGTSSYPLMVVIPTDEYKDILETFSNIPKIKVSDYCVGADKDPDTGRIQKEVENATGINFVIGLGDYLANKNDETKKILTTYKNMELKNNARIVLLLSPHMYPALKEIADLRAKTRIILPKIAPPIPTINSKSFVYGIQAFLDACERGEFVENVKSGRKITTTNVINPENAYDELRHKFPSEFRRLLKNAGSIANWGELLENLNKSKKNIGQYLADFNSVPPEYTFFDYAKRNDYTAWLYFINLKLNTTPQSYLGFAASKCDSLDSLFSIAKSAILDIAVTEQRFTPFYKQRKTLLKSVADVDMADYIPKIAIRGEDRIAYLTDITTLERKEVIISLCDGAKNDALSVSYPDLNLYLESFIFEDSRFTEYFKAYKKCKVTNKIDEDFMRLVDEYAIKRPYNSLPARSTTMSNLDDGKALLIFLDAMGVEYLGFIKEKCAELNLRFVAKAARAELPTITNGNRGFYDEWKGKKETAVKDLDDIKHNPERGYDYNNSSYPIHLAEELEVIKTALERAKTKLQTYGKIVIASDHGASRLAVISPDTKIHSTGCEVLSNGRYCVGENLPMALNMVTEGQYAVLADYSRFDGSRVAGVETHGGATLEEVIVPVIELTLSDDNKEVTLESDVVEVSFDIAPTLIMFITPDCDNVTAAVGGKFCEVEKLEKSKFRVTMSDLKKGEYTLKIFENQNRIADKKFTVKSKGFAVRDNMF